MASDTPMQDAAVTPSVTAPLQHRTSPVARAIDFVLRRIATKIVVPYLVLMALMASIGTFVVVQIITQSLEERLLNQLVDSGRKANDAMVAQEQDNLRVVRAVSFTEGVAQATLARDAAYLERVILPIHANSSADYVFILDTTGAPVLSMRVDDSDGDGDGVGTIKSFPLDGDVKDWPSVQFILRGSVDQYGDKYAEWRLMSQGYGLFTTGAVRDLQGRLVGVAVVGSTDRRVIERLNRDSLAAITFYGRDGRIIGTTLPYVNLDSGADITGSDERFNRLRQLDREQVVGFILRRNISIGERLYAEILGALEVRKLPGVILGVALPADYIGEKQVVSRDQLTALFMGAVSAVMLVGMLISRRISTPIRAVSAAATQVNPGSLNFYVEPTTVDETAELTVQFNRMLARLRRHEQMVETYGLHTPAELAEYLQEPDTDVRVTGERREVTVLAVRVQNYTALTERLAPEELVTTLNHYYAAVARIITDRHGRVESLLGETLMAVFGAPIPRLDHAPDAARAAMSISDTLADLNRERLGQGAPAINVGVALHTGDAVVAAVGPNGAQTYAAFGEAVNRAVRIAELAAETQSVLASDAAYQTISSLVTTGEPRLVTVRGAAAPLAVYPLLSVSAAARPYRSTQGLFDAEQQQPFGGSAGDWS